MTLTEQLAKLWMVGERKKIINIFTLQKTKKQEKILSDRKGIFVPLMRESSQPDGPLDHSTVDKDSAEGSCPLGAKGVGVGVCSGMKKSI